MGIIHSISKADLGAAVDIVYESVALKGKNTHRLANHQLMDMIKDLVGDECSRDCWVRIWEKYQKPLTDLGYVRSW